MIQMWYDKQGQPITDAMQIELLLRDVQYKHVALTKIARDNGAWEISTVWMGLDHGFGAPPPVIFETMVFEWDDRGDLDCERYRTLDQARDGHEHMVRKWAAQCPGAKVEHLGWESRISAEERPAGLV